ncbi:glycosyl hydrolase family 28-related protein [Actinoplanes sp. GCM10030250]|uniref:glycosyl hydrolase family 28-related protein n=1 Tax=Actinoplanes sp. GCM10030250 TaxID=3273376 RepID=UPI003618029A
MTPWTTVIGNTVRVRWKRWMAGPRTETTSGTETARSVPSPSRRALLTGGGAVVVGAGVTGAAVGRYTSDTEVTSSPFLDVRQFGAAGDGKTDDTRALQKALDAAAAGAGLVYLPAGTYLTRRLTLASNVHMRGAGGDATVLQLHPGANSAILESAGFADLTGTSEPGGITGFSVRDLALDGNKDKNAEGGYGLRIYGCQYELSEVIVFNCRQDGIYSEWSGASGLPGLSHQMEARLTAVRSHHNGGTGINFNGPHDSMFVNCLAFENEGIGFRLAGEAHATSLVNCHGWGIAQTVSFDLAALAIGCVNCYADFNGGVGVRISRNDCRWWGGFVIGANHTGNRREIGIQFVPGPVDGEPAGCVIDTKIMNCATASIDFGNDFGHRSTVRASLTQPGVHVEGEYVEGTGAPWIGSPSRTCRIEIVEGVNDPTKSLVVSPAFEMRAQEVPGRPGEDSVRVFVRTSGGDTQLCAQFPNGVIKVIAAE